jgi:hypothetical protein
MTALDPSFRYVWLNWACAFLLPWALLFIARPALRGPMLWASALTAPFGLTEPLFVPAYWNPPSLLDLAQRTGFDIESLIFCFAIGCYRCPSEGWITVRARLRVTGCTGWPCRRRFWCSRPS